MTTSPRHRGPRRAPTPARAGLLVAASAGVLLACGGDEPTKVEAYCGSVRSNLTALVSPAIATQADIDAALALYRSIGADAPVAVQPEWEALVTNLETAATVNPDDEASRQAAADAARRTQPAAVRVQHYTQQNCGVDIGTPPPTTNPVTATTVPESTDSAGG